MAYKHKIKNESKEQRFWKRVNIPLDDAGQPIATACWLWQGKPHGGGYGKFDYKGQSYIAHRYSLELKLGRPIGDDMQANHVGDCNKLCCNPQHIYEGNQSQNMKDKWANGKHIVSPKTRRRFARLAKARFRGTKRTEECKARMSATQKARWDAMTEEERATQQAAMTPLWKALGKGMPKSQRKRISDTMMGHDVSEETRQRMSEKAKARWAKYREQKMKILEGEKTT